MRKKIACYLVFLAVSCSHGMGQTDTAIAAKAISGNLPIPPADSVQVVGEPRTGLATMYSSSADGFKTASGEIFSNTAFTAACKQFKFNTWIKVTNLVNGKTVLVRINDRITKKIHAPLLILSRAAVSALGFLRTGTAKIKIQQIVLNDSSSHKIEKSPTDSLRDTSLVKQKVDTIVKGKPVLGIASFYSANLDGTKTSTGERYRNAKMTAASNHFKLNTWVRVTNLRNQKTIVVRINDHMHPRMKKKGRVVDLSREAARQLDFMEAGLVKVRVEALEFRVLPVATDTLTIQDTVTKRTDSLVLPVDSVKQEVTKKDSGILFGIASFYSTNLDGTQTATGERYRNAKLSAASNDFTLGSWVRVTNLSNSKSVILRINDRMHPRMQKKGRVVDLSRAAAKKLDFINKGLTKVKVELVEKSTPN